MNVIVIGAGNSGLAAAAHLSKEGDTVVLWNRSRETIAGLLTSGKIVLHGAIEGEYTIPLITDDLEEALGFFEPQVILVTQHQPPPTESWQNCWPNTSRARV